MYYGVVGNGETAALIGPDLAVRWLCLPRFDGTPFFASALDPRRGGELTIEVYVVVEYGTKISVIANNIIQKVRYNVENFTGLSVTDITVNIEGVRF